MKQLELKLEYVDTPVSVANDMLFMHTKFDVYSAVRQMDKEKLLAFLKFRFCCIQEEIEEGLDAIDKKDAEEIVDALIDAVVFAVGTLDLFDVNFDKGWKEVLVANLAKNVGIKSERPNPWGLPDLVKPVGWTAPSHAGNHGKLTELFE